MLRNPEPGTDPVPITQWDRAQRAANFVLLRPKPASGWTAEVVSLRPESKAHPSTQRMILSGAGLRIRLKASLNDWWVPVANDLNLRRVKAHALAGDELVCLGTDYHRKPGACAQILGTTVEAYAEAGEPSPDEWTGLYQSLEAAVPDVVAEARRTTFAERHYWNRWKRPVGMWDSHEFTRPQWMRPNPDTFAQVAWGSTPDRWAPMPGAPDSIATLSEAKTREMQVLFRQPMTLNYTSWLRIRDPSDPEGPVAPRDPRYPRLSHRATFGGRDVSLAGLTPLGPWFFAWSEGTRGFELHVRGGKNMDQARAVAVATAVLG